MADVHMLNALTAKRRELIGQIEDRRWERKHRSEELAHLEATIQLLDPQWVPDRVPVRGRGRRRRFFRSAECQRLVLEAQRKAEAAIPEDVLVATLLAGGSGRGTGRDP